MTRKTSPRRLLGALTGSMILTLTVMLPGQSSAEARPAAIPGMVDASVLADRLGLSTDQEPLFLDIMAEHKTRVMALLKAHNVDPSAGRPPLGVMMAMRPDMKAIQETLKMQLSAVLSRSQLRQLKQLQAEARRNAGK